MSAKQMNPWDQLEGLPQDVSATKQMNPWDQLEGLPANEGLGKSIARGTVQPLLGAAEMTVPGMATSAWQLLGTGEALDELSQWEGGREAELRKKFPQAPWKEQPAFNKEKYLQALQTASKTVPTVENIASFIEKNTGLPLEARNKLQKKLRLAGSAGKLRPGGITDKIIAGTVAGGTSGGLEALGIPETIADIAGLGAPGFSKKIIPNRAQKEFVDFARKMGLTENQITPAIQSARKQKLFSGIASKGKKTQEALQESNLGIGGIYDTLSTKPEAKKILNAQQANKFANEIANVAVKMPMESRQRILGDVYELAKTKFSGEGLINFWQDLNYYIPRGERSLGRFKEPLTNALKDINPELAKDFVKTNKAFSNLAQLRKNLKPALSDQIVSGGKAYKFIGAILEGNFGTLAKTLKNLAGITAAQKFAANLLINPRYQNLFRQMVNSLNTNKVAIAMKLKDKLSDELEKEYPELAEEIRAEKF